MDETRIELAGGWYVQIDGFNNQWLRSPDGLCQGEFFRREARAFAAAGLASHRVPEELRKHSEAASDELSLPTSNLATVQFLLHSGEWVRELLAAAPPNEGAVAGEDGWLPISTDPPRGNCLVQVRAGKGSKHYDSSTPDKPFEMVAHWAQDLSGEEQPPFRGWFYWNGLCFVEVPGRVVAFRPINASPHPQPDLVAERRDEVEDWKAAYDGLWAQTHQAVDDAQEQARAAEAAVVKLREALEPFARQNIEAVRKVGDFHLWKADFRLARQALAERPSMGRRGMGSERQTNLHNRLAGQIVASIVKPPLQAGGTFTDVMVLTESVLVGVALACIKLGGDNVVLDTMFEGAKARLAEIRLSDLPTGGSA